jgi:hypothetical protein
LNAAIRCDQNRHIDRGVRARWRPFAYVVAVEEAPIDVEEALFTNHTSPNLAFRLGAPGQKREEEVSDERRTS